MAASPNTGEKQFAEIVGRIFKDDKFAESLEQNPEKALRDAGFQLDEQQVKALHAGKAEVHNVAAAAGTAAFVRPVVSVLTKGTRPAVSVITNSAVVASSAQAQEEKKP
jgi:hypothetical protein